MTDETSNPAEARAQHRFEVLRELVDIGMELARDVRREALAPVAPEAAKVDYSLRFGRIARAVRQTLALQERFDAEHRERRAKVEKSSAGEARVRGLMRKIKVGEIVERVLDETDAEHLTDALNERLEDAEDTAFADRPLGELVAGVCRDLGVTIDWSVWTDETWGLEAAAAEAQRAAEPGAADGLRPPAAPPDEPALVLSG
jgi:hypothetical protein